VNPDNREKKEKRAGTTLPAGMNQVQNLVADLKKKRTHLGETGTPPGEQTKTDDAKRKKIQSSGKKTGAPSWALTNGKTERDLMVQKH